MNPNDPNHWLTTQVYAVNGEVFVGDLYLGTDLTIDQAAELAEWILAAVGEAKRQQARG